MRVKFKKAIPEAVIPEKAHPSDAGFDLVNPTAFAQIAPGDLPYIVDTGITVRIPKGFVGFVCSRSGLATQGLYVLNAPGIIDPGYRGTIKVILKSTMQTQIHPGQRIAQLVVVPCLNKSRRLERLRQALLRVGRYLGIGRGANGADAGAQAASGAGTRGTNGLGSTGV